MEQYYLAMDNIVEAEGKLWFFSFKDNFLCCMKKDTFDVEVVLAIPKIGGSLNRAPQYGKIIWYDRKIYIIPNLMIDIIVYDIQEKSIKSISYPREPFVGMVFLDAVRCNSKLYLIPCEYNKILCVDLETDTVSISASIDRNVQAWGNIWREQENVLFGCMSKGIIYNFNIENKNIEEIDCKKSESGITGIWRHDDEYCIIPNELDKIVISNKNFSRFNEIKIDLPDYKPHIWSVYKSVAIGSVIYCLPRMANKVLVFNMETHSIKTLDFCDKAVTEKLEWLDYMPISNVWKQNGRVICAYSKSGQFYDIYTGEHISVNVSVGIDKLKMDYCGLIKEDYGYLASLKNFIKVLT